MARGHNRKGRSNGGERHIRLPYYLLQSAAYRSLSCVARAVLIEAVAFYRGENNGYLVLPAREIAERIRSHPSTAARALIELDDVGFIKPMFIGTFNTKRRASEYRLTWLACDRGHTKPTNEFMDYGKIEPRRGPSVIDSRTSETT